MKNLLTAIAHNGVIWYENPFFWIIGTVSAIIIIAAFIRTRV